MYLILPGVGGGSSVGGVGNGVPLSRRDGALIGRAIHANPIGLMRPPWQRAPQVPSPVCRSIRCRSVRGMLGSSAGKGGTFIGGAGRSDGGTLGRVRGRRVWRHRAPRSRVAGKYVGYLELSLLQVGRQFLG